MSASSKAFADQAPLRGKVPGLGVSLILSALLTTACAIAPWSWLLVLLIVIPAVYVVVGARPALVPEGHSTIAHRLIAGNAVFADDSSPVGTDEWRRAVPSSLRDSHPFHRRHPSDESLGYSHLPLRGTFTNTPEPRAEWNPDPSGARAVLQNVDYSESLEQGLLTGSQGEGPHLGWLARLLGYICTAFLVACATGSLVGLLSGARLSFPPYRSLARLPNPGARARSQIALATQPWVLRQAYARAPPIRIAVPSRNVAGAVPNVHLTRRRHFDDEPKNAEKCNREKSVWCPRLIVPLIVIPIDFDFAI